MQSKKNYRKLVFCIIFDLIGVLSVLIPFLDVLWAPLSSGILLKMFGLNFKGKLAAIIGFFEEILPVTDIIPTFTVFWVYETFFEKKIKTLNNK